MKDKTAKIGRPREHDETCSLWYCDGQHFARGLCARHYIALLRNDSVLGANRINSDLTGVLEVMGEIEPVLKKLALSEDAGLSYGERVMCIYCGALAVEEVDQDGNYQLTVDHKEECPIHVGRRLAMLIDGTDHILSGDKWRKVAGDDDNDNDNQGVN